MLRAHICREHLRQEKKLRMQTSPKIADANSDGGSASVSSTAAEPAALDLPEAAPWTGNWSHLIGAWLLGAVVLAGLLVFIMHFGAIEVFLAKLRGANPLWLAARPWVANWRPMSAPPLSGSVSSSGLGLRCRF
jgi:hypothetical protein